MLVFSARRLDDPEYIDRYSIIKSGRSFFHETPLNFYVGKVLCNKRFGIKQLDFSEIDRILKEVIDDIPDARLLLFSQQHEEHRPHSF